MKPQHAQASEHTQANEHTQAIFFVLQAEQHPKLILIMLF
jgi:hypothetical protein